MVLLRTRGICQQYNSVTALENINLEFKRGEIHAIIGEHGAGKSTLAHIVAGMQRPLKGELYWKGKLMEPLIPGTAMALGIRIVAQNNPLYENMTVAENLLLDNKAGLYPFITRRKNLQTAGEYIEKMDFDLDPSTLLSDLKLSDKVLVDILRHLYHHPRFLLMDETLEKLSSENQSRLLDILNKRTAAGEMGVMFISHRVDDIYNIAHRITIIREGRVLLTEKVDHIDKTNLIRLAYTHSLNTRDVLTKETFSQILKYNEAVIKDLPVSFVILDGSGKIRMQNTAAENILGSNIGDKRIIELIPPGNEKFSKILKKSFSNRKYKTYYQIPLKKNGKNLLFNLTIYPITERSTLLGNILIMTDITEQEKLREKITLSENLASLGLLSAGVAHEINNPLDIMGYCLENLKFSGINEKQMDIIRGIEEEIESVAKIVGNLIAFSDRSSSEVTIFDPGDLLQSLTRLLKVKAEESGITIEFSRAGESCQVKADKNELRQVFLNLAYNAFEVMPDGGSLGICLKTEKDLVIILFEDTGPGIPADQQKEIFLPFFSTKAATGRNMGLGLPLSYRIMQKYKGTIRVENRRRGGCRFQLSLKRQK